MTTPAASPPSPTPGETSSNVAYSYDSTTGGNKGIGRLTGVTDAAGTVAYSYDLLGRTTGEERVIGSQTYTTAYEYDAAGSVVNETYPSGRIVFFDRDDDGKVEVIRTLPPGGSMAWLVQWVGRTPFGPRSGISFGNETREWRHYDQDGRITELETLVDTPPSQLIDWTYAYGDKRSLTGIADLLNSANNQFYTYTDNGFLQTAGGPWSAPGAFHGRVYCNKICHNCWDKGFRPQTYEIPAPGPKKLTDE